MVHLTANDVFLTFTALAMLLAGAYGCGKLVERVNAPRVVGEIMGGMLFGGTFLGWLLPGQMAAIFQGYAEEGKVLDVFYQLGLVFLMFCSGFNTKIELSSANRRLIARLFAGATILPMLAALPLAAWFSPHFIGSCGNAFSFNLVFVIGVAITSIPVISKIFFDMGIMKTVFANTVLTVATFQDLFLWILLNMATRTAATGEVHLGEMVLVVLITLGIFAAVKMLTDRVQGYARVVKATDFYTISFIALLLVCALLHKLGINIMYSAFLVGYALKSISSRDAEAAGRMQAVVDFSFSFFVPIYFALVGIQLNLLHNFSPLRFAVFFVLAFALEGIGVILPLLPTKLKKESIWNFAVTMNARGGPGIVLATVAYSSRIINVEFFTILILTTMLSSMIAGYWLRRQKNMDDTIFVKLYTQEHGRA